MSALGLIAEGRADRRARREIAEWMSGNLCRCGAYPNIVAAIAAAARSWTCSRSPFIVRRAMARRWRSPPRIPAPPSSPAAPTCCSC